MTRHLKVDRYLEDKAMDHIDHALGRPLNPLADTYRDHFAIDAGSTEAKAFEASPYWEKAEKSAPGRMLFFYVTDAGRRALAKHLAAIGDKHRQFDVTFEGHAFPVVSTTASKARYSAYLDISDLHSELTFAAFCRKASVRAAALSASGNESATNDGGACSVPSSVPAS